MKSSPPGYPDHFEIVNGPEDGTRFPIGRTPVDMGSDGSCGIFIALDNDVKRFHARVTVVSDGYRIRRLGGAGPVHVNGKRAGLIRSRIVRHAGVVRVGNTELCLLAAPEGLASRSYGLPTESDAAWFLRLLAAQVLDFFQWARRVLFNTAAFLLRHWMLTFAFLAFLSWLRSDLFWAAVNSVRYFLYWLRWRVGGA